MSSPGEIRPGRPSVTTSTAPSATREPVPAVTLTLGSTGTPHSARVARLIGAAVFAWHGSPMTPVEVDEIDTPEPSWCAQHDVEHGATEGHTLTTHRSADVDEWTPVGGQWPLTVRVERLDYGTAPDDRPEIVVTGRDSGNAPAHLSLFAADARRLAAALVKAATSAEGGHGADAGTALSAIREGARIDIDALARASGVDRATLERIEAGEARMTVDQYATIMTATTNLMCN